MKSSQPDNLVDMGYIAGAFGIQGWVKTKVATEYVDSLVNYSNIYLKLADGRTINKKIEGSSVKNGIFHVKFEGINDRDAAFSIRGATIAVERTEFPELELDEFYWVDLIGSNVINLQNESLGIVKSLLETGANDVLVARDADKTERLIPFIAQYVIEVDIKNKQIIVDWGLDY